MPSLVRVRLSLICYVIDNQLVITLARQALGDTEFLQNCSVRLSPMSISALTDGVLLEAERYVDRYLKEYLPASRSFHNFLHAQTVVENCELMAAEYDLTWADSEELFIAAWFHDLGYCRGREKHEEESVKIAEEFLLDHKIPDERRRTISNLILCTLPACEPISLAAKILRDADVGHVGSVYYPIFTQLLKQELEIADGIKFTEVGWAENNIRFLEGHRFQTDYAMRTWDSQKQENLRKLIAFLNLST